MRKIYFLLLSLIIGVSAMAANPTLYLRGAITGSNWPALPAYQFTENNGVYTLSLKSLTGEFQIADANWTEQYGNGQTLKLDTDYVLNGKSNMKPDGSFSDVVLTFTYATKTLRITGKSAESVITYSLNGQFTNASWGVTPMTETDGKWTVKLSPTVPSGGFGVRQDADGVQSGYFKGDVMLSETNPSVTLVAESAGGSGDPKYSLTAGKEYTFTFDPATGKLDITFEGAPVGPTYPEKLYVIGNVNDGAFVPNNTVALEKGATDGCYEGEVTFTGADGTEFSYFQFATATGSNDEDWAGLGTRYGAPEKDAVPTEEPSEITYNDMSWKIANGTVTVKVNLADMTMCVVGADVPAPVVPETLYILGNIDDNDWNPTTPIEMTKIGNTFTVEAEAVANADGKSFFSFCSAKGSTNDNAGWGELSSSDRYGAATEGAVATVGTSFAYTVYKANVNAIDCKSWSIAPNTEGHKYKFTVDFDKQTVTVAMASGVDSIEAENDGEAVYFNLQGVRVDNPENGIFVRVANGKAVKVVK